MCDSILVTLLKMRPHHSQSSRENGTPSSGTYPLASYKEVTPRGGGGGLKYVSVNHRLLYDLRKPVIKIKDTYDSAYLKKNK